LAAGVVAACLATSAARAEVALFSANISDQSFTSPANSIGSAFVDLTGSRVTRLNFTTTAARQRVTIIFSAGCSIVAGGDPGWLEVNILVDPAGPVGELTVPPTNRAAGGSILCQGGPGDNGAAATVVASARPDQAGTNTIRVRAKFASFVG